MKTGRVALAAAVLLLGVGVVGQPALAAPQVPVATGDNGFGQLGVPGGDRTTPGPVSGPAATAIASGRDNAYLLTAAGRIWSWGINDKGQIGDGTTTNRITPVQLAPTNITAVSAGHYHALALAADQRVFSWGYGAMGQLGRGSTANSTSPTQVPGLTNIVALGAGRDMSYAVNESGQVYAWGNNVLGEIGDGTSTRRTSPTLVPGVDNIVEIAGGRNHALALDSNGAVWAWGDNTYGQIGDGTTTVRRSAVRVIAGGVRHVDAGAQHSLAVTTDGRVFSWGRGYRGQLGHGSTAGQTAPRQVAGLPSITEVGDGRDSSFAITASGDVWAWGDNVNGQLGDGTTTRRTSPVRISALSDIGHAEGGAAHTVFLPTDDTPPQNQPPIASFTTTCSALTCMLNSGASSDPDGTVSQRTWTWTGGGSSSATNPQVTFPSAGTYTITLVVTDNEGAQSAPTSHTVTVSTQPGTASFVAAAGATANAQQKAVSVAGVQAGDRMVLFATVNTAATFTTPPGWTSLAQQADGTDLRTAVFTRVAGTAADGTVTVQVSATSKMNLQLLAYRGIGTDLRVAGAAEPGSPASHVTPTMASPFGAATLISHWVDKSAATTSWTVPGGVDRSWQNVASTGSGRVQSATTASTVAAGTVGGLTATAQPNSASGKATMWSVVLPHQ